LVLLESKRFSVYWRESEREWEEEFKDKGERLQVYEGEEGGEEFS
jgi:hypothetical protein